VDISLILLGKKIRVISFLTNTIFTIQTTAQRQLDLDAILEYAASKMHEDLEGIVTQVAHIDRLQMNELCDIQASKEFFATLVVSEYSSFMTLNPSGIRIWPSATL
jgi:hypothetical protein